MALKADKVLIYPELSYQIMEIAFEVHNQLGPGFTEDIYEKAMIQELKSRKIPYANQEPVDIYYKGQLIGTYRLDIVINNQIILELKSVSSLNEIYGQQLLSYLKATKMRLGILINFGTKRVEYHRIVN